MTIFEAGILVVVVIAGLAIVQRMRRKEIDTTRLDTLQANKWQVGCIDGKFAVLGGSPPRVISPMTDDVRQAIDQAGQGLEVQRG